MSTSSNHNSFHSSTTHSVSHYRFAQAFPDVVDPQQVKQLHRLPCLHRQHLAVSQHPLQHHCTGLLILHSLILFLILIFLFLFFPLFFLLFTVSKFKMLYKLSLLFFNLFFSYFHYYNLLMHHFPFSCRMTRSGVIGVKRR